MADEWAAFEQSLAVLTDDQVRVLAHKLGIQFTNTQPATREDYVNVLDEAYWDEFAEAYQALTRNETL